MEERMKNDQYKETLKKDDSFFFRIPKKLGSGSKKDVVHIMMTSRGLMENLQYINDGVFQIDGTYRLTKNNYPWIVCGIVDLRGVFHPIAFMISNQETVYEFSEFFSGLVDLATDLGYIFDPEYVMMDASDATYNAVKKIFKYSTILMCYFHVMKNIKSNCQRPLPPIKYDELLEDIRHIHMCKSDEYDSCIMKFKHKWDSKSTKEVYNYCSTWFTGRFCKWQIFHHPPGWANTNIESFKH